MSASAVPLGRAAVPEPSHANKRLRLSRTALERRSIVGPNERLAATVCAYCTTNELAS
jgi:hypothetical protein